MEDGTKLSFEADIECFLVTTGDIMERGTKQVSNASVQGKQTGATVAHGVPCLLYTSPSPRD